MDGEYIVFNPQSDEVHRLNAMASAALSELESQPMDLQSLAQSMASLMEIDLGTDLLQSMHKLLMDLDETGLILASSPAPVANSTCKAKHPG